MYQYDNCFSHGCEKCSTNRDYSGNLKETNCLTGKNIKDLQKTTQENTEKLEAEGLGVCRITECEWQQMKKSPEISSFLKKLKCVEPRKQPSFKKILKGIKNDTLYGFLFVDIHTPDELKPKFADFPMIIKNAMISRKDLSPYMLKIAEEQGCLKKPRQYLISS